MKISQWASNGRGVPYSASRHSLKGKDPQLVYYIHLIYASKRNNGDCSRTTCLRLVFWTASSPAGPPRELLRNVMHIFGLVSAMRFMQICYATTNFCIAPNIHFFYLEIHMGAFFLQDQPIWLTQNWFKSCDHR